MWNECFWGGENKDKPRPGDQDDDVADDVTYYEKCKKMSEKWKLNIARNFPQFDDEAKNEVRGDNLLAAGCKMVMEGNEKFELGRDIFN